MAEQVYVRRRLADGKVLPELGLVLSVDPRDATARVRWLKQNRTGTYRLSELVRHRGTTTQ
jgi:hypothetical protein